MNGDAVENYRRFVRERLAPAGLAREFGSVMLELAKEQSKCVALPLDARQRDALYGTIAAFFKIVDMTEEALKPQSGKPTPDAEGGFL